jgi:hypothetical protein
MRLSPGASKKKRGAYGLPARGHDAKHYVDR